MTIYSNAIHFRPVTQSLVWLRRALAIWRSRRAMAGMDRAMLSDLGLSASAAAYEASRPFWDMELRDGQ